MQTEDAAVLAERRKAQRRATMKRYRAKYADRIRATAAQYRERHNKVNREYRLRKKQGEEMPHGQHVTPLVGSTNPRWKGGVSQDPAYRAAKAQEWREAHREQWALLIRRYRIKKNENGGTHTLAEWGALKEFYDYTCLGCGKREPEITLERDHIVPVSKGGTSDISNIQPLCESCNSSKKDKMPEVLSA